jgi:hypothetical protein
MLTTQEFELMVEEYIDSSNVANALDAIATVCREKAEHIRANWQDQATANNWDVVAKRIDTAIGTAMDRDI